jgi:uncharacterized protein (DUF885 family)
MTTLNELIDAYERTNLDEHGPLAGAAFTATYRAAQGLPVSRIAPETEAANQETRLCCEGLLAQLDDVNASLLDEQQRISHAVLRAAIERRLEDTRYYWHSIPVTPYRSFVAAFRIIFRAFDVDNDEARRRYFAVVKDVAEYARSILVKVQGQVQRGIVLPERAIATVVALHRSAAGTAASPFFPGQEKLAVLGDATRERFLNEAHAVLQERVVPTLEELAEFLAGPYAEAASPSLGQSTLSGGEEYYRYLVRINTTLDLEPEEIHARGLRAVGELRQEMAEVRSRLGFNGSAAEFHELLRRDQRFVPRAPEQIGERLERFAHLADGSLNSYFLRRPAASFAAKRLPADLEGGMTFGYYHLGARAGDTGFYFYNGSNLPERSLLSLASLALHELIPGHHYEMNVARENADLPRFRAFQSILTYIAAYHEGWAEYAADLGKAFGAYEDPYDLYGRYALDIFVSCRLVVDTGLNALGWTFERAAEYMRENTLQSPTEVASEVLRYATDLPAQGLAYKLGSLKFAELRDKERARLGPAFDIRAFHDRIVSNGGMPLTLLESCLS